MKSRLRSELREESVNFGASTLSLTNLTSDRERTLLSLAQSSLCRFFGLQSLLGNGFPLQQHGRSPAVGLDLSAKLLRTSSHMYTLSGSGAAPLRCTFSSEDSEVINRFAAASGMPQVRDQPSHG